MKKTSSIKLALLSLAVIGAFLTLITAYISAIIVYSDVINFYRNRLVLGQIIFDSLYILMFVSMICIVFYTWKKYKLHT